MAPPKGGAWIRYNIKSGGSRHPYTERHRQRNLQPVRVYASEYGLEKKESEIETLSRKAQSLKNHIEALKTRINRMEHRHHAPGLVAVVDEQMCAGCALCLEACPAGAVSVNGVARIDSLLCTGCGNCAASCRRGAISLNPLPRYRQSRK